MLVQIHAWRVHAIMAVPVYPTIMDHMNVCVVQIIGITEIVVNIVRILLIFMTSELKIIHLEDCYTKLF